MPQQRHRFKQKITLQDRLKLFSNSLRKRADELGPGAEKEALLKRARIADTAAHIDEWINSPGLQAPQ